MPSPTLPEPFNLGPVLVCPADYLIDGARVDPIAMAVLPALKASYPQIMGTQELLEEVWQGRVVVENVVHRAMTNLRAALKDSPRTPVYIETIRGRGYRLLVEPMQAPVSEKGQDRPRVLFSIGEATAERVDHNTYLSAVGDSLAAALSKSSTLDVIPHGQDDKDTGNYSYQCRCILHAAKQGASLAFQLLRVEPNNLAWAEEYSVSKAELDNLSFDKTPHVARLIQAFIGVVEDSRRLKTSSPKIHDLWITNQVERNKILLGANGSWQLAVSTARQAIELDPSFMEAYQELAILYADRLGLKLSATEAGKHANQNISKAIKLQPDNWFNFFTLGKINHELELDYAASQQNLDQALRLGGPIGAIDTQLGICLLKEVRLDDAIRHLESAIAGDTFGSVPATLIAWGIALVAQGELSQAIEIFKRAERTAGPSEIAVNIRLRLASTYQLMGEQEPAEIALDSAWQLAKDRDDLFPGVFAQLGQEDKARPLMQTLERKHEQQRYVRPAPMFLANYYLGDIDAAFRWLDLAIEDRDGWIFPTLRQDPSLNALRTDVRYRAALEKLDALETHLP